MRRYKGTAGGYGICALGAVFGRHPQDRGVATERKVLTAHKVLIEREVLPA